MKDKFLPVLHRQFYYICFGLLLYAHIGLYRAISADRPRWDVCLQVPKLLLQQNKYGFVVFVILLEAFVLFQLKAEKFHFL